jgi:hypothetical protein
MRNEEGKEEISVSLEEKLNKMVNNQEYLIALCKKAYAETKKVQVTRNLKSSVIYGTQNGSLGALLELSPTTYSFLFL